MKRNDRLSCECFHSELLHQEDCHSRVRARCYRSLFLIPSSASVDIAASLPSGQTGSPNSIITIWTNPAQKKTDMNCTALTESPALNAYTLKIIANGATLTNNGLESFVDLGTQIFLSYIHLSIQIRPESVADPCREDLSFQVIRFGGLPYPISTQFFIIYARNFDVNVDTIQQRTRNPLLIFGNDSRCTPTGFLWVRKPTARAEIHGCDHLEGGSNTK